jgi:small-conductance mechanosensitive channel
MKVELVLDEKSQPLMAGDGVYVVKIPLTENEYADLAKEIGEKVIKKLQITEEKKEVMSDYNEKINAEEKEIERLSFYIKYGHKEDRMALEVQKDQYRNVLEYLDDDGEVVATIPMTDMDKQEELKLRKKKLMEPPEPDEELQDTPEDEPILEVTESGWAKPRSWAKPEKGEE